MVLFSVSVRLPLSGHGTRSIRNDVLQRPLVSNEDDATTWLPASSSARSSPPPRSAELTVTDVDPVRIELVTSPPAGALENVGRFASSSVILAPNTHHVPWPSRGQP